MTRQELVQHIFSRNNYLCVGLDTDLQKIPPHLRDHPDAMFEFNRRIIDATLEHCVAYKINTAFYESEGVKGWDTLQRTAAYIPSTHFRIADAKRGDIGNTSQHYARAFFEVMDFDAVTAAPYMGADSVRPFLEYEGKWTILLGLTSNPGAADFELQKLIRTDERLDEGIHVTRHTENYLYEEVLKKASGWGTPDNLMFVIGATRPEQFEHIRKLTPDHFYLVPGVGAQGGSLEEISLKAMNSEGGLLVNASRAVIYASGGEDFAEVAGAVARDYALQMKGYLAAQKK